MVGGFLYGEFRIETQRWQVTIVDIENSRFQQSQVLADCWERLLR